jgi:hypothetical protein
LGDWELGRDRESIGCNESIKVRSTVIDSGLWWLQVPIMAACCYPYK